MSKVVDLDKEDSSITARSTLVVLSFPYRLDPVSDSHDELALLPHAVDKVHRDEAGVVGLGELAGGAVERAAETVALRERLCIT